jgi:hypothetical protein
LVAPKVLLIACARKQGAPWGAPREVTEQHG